MSKSIKYQMIAIILGIAALLCSFCGCLDRFDVYMTDYLYQRPVTVNNDIKIIAIDEKTLEALGPYNQWDRAVYAQLLQTLNGDEQNMPAVICFDILFVGGMSQEGDVAFAKEAASAGNVVTAVNMVFKETISENSEGKKYLDRMNVEMVEYPYDSLKKEVEMGFANTIQDGRDNRVRKLYVTLGNEKEVEALSIVTARKYCEKLGLPFVLPETEENGTVAFHYSGNPGDYETLSMIDVLNGKIPAEVFKDSLVMVGAYTTGMMDAYFVPNVRGSQMYGVEIHANIIQAMLDGRTMIEMEPWAAAVINGAAVAVFFMLVRKKRLSTAFILGMVWIGGDIGLGMYLAEKGTFFPLIIIPVFVVMIEIGLSAQKYVGELLKKRRIMNAFRKYVAPQVVEEISKKGDFVLKLGGEKRHVAVLFVDIRGFTSMSESLKPEQIVEILNEYLTLTTHSILNNGGTLDKFIGDATMAVFNAPFDLDDYIYRAVCTARDIAAGSEWIGKKFMERFGKTVSFGIGVNCGEAVVGNIGCEFRMDYTAIGDTVNTAARLESNAKAGQILISESVYDALKNRLEVTEIGEIPLKGKLKGVMVYQVDKVL